jgi:hypothetical protein
MAQLNGLQPPQLLPNPVEGYLCSGEKVRPVFFSDANSGGLATALGNAMSDKDGRLHELFVERLPHGTPASRVKQVFSGKYFRGKGGQERRIFVRSDRLQPDCIELYWTLQGPDRIADLEVVRDLAQRIRKDLGIPEEPAPPEGEESVPPKPAPAKTPEPPPSAKAQQPEQGELPGASPNRTRRDAG